MRTMLWLTMAAGLSPACGTTHRVERTDLNPVVDEAEGGKVDLELRSGRSMAVGGLHAEGDTMVWSSPAPGSIPASDVRAATVVRRGKGFWEGAAIGASAGFLTGLAIGVVWNTTCHAGAGPISDGESPQSTCPYSDGPSLTRGLELGALFGGLLLIPGGVVGGVVGAVRGDRTTFSIDENPRRP